MVNRRQLHMRGQTLARHRVGMLLLFLLLTQAKGGVAQTLLPTFEVASVRPSAPQADPNTGSWSIPGSNRFIASHVSLARLIQLAYDVDNSQIVNKPDWLDTILYDVTAKAEDGVRLTREELRLASGICCISGSIWWLTSKSVPSTDMPSSLLRAVHALHRQNPSTFPVSEST